MAVEVSQQPSMVKSDQGFVLVDGPAGVAFTMTADAASETARRLLACAAEAQRQTGLACSVDGDGDLGST